MDMIKEKQRLWAKRNGKNMRTGYKFYTNTVEENLFKNLSPATEKEFNDANGGELKDTEKHPAKMAALFSSSALCVNVFQYFRDKSVELKLELLKACRLISNDYDCDDIIIKFECTDYPICNDKNKISNPNIDVVIITKRGEKENRIFAIESKFTEPYGIVENFLAEKYYQTENKSIWNSLGTLYESLNIDQVDEITRTRKRDEKEVTEKGKHILTKYKYLNALQLIKHLMGLRGKRENKAQIKLVYVWYDALGKEGFEHRNEIKEFRELIEKNTGIRFRDISYQELIYNLNKQLPYNEHKEYLNYITERYL